MKALVMKEYREFVYTDVPTPVPEADEVRVRVKACAVCGSDVHGIDGSTSRRRPPSSWGMKRPGSSMYADKASGGINPGTA